MFYDILERKNDFLREKTPSLKCRKIEKFYSKIGHFSNFFSFGNIGWENVFYDILD